MVSALGQEDQRFGRLSRQVDAEQPKFQLARGQLAAGAFNCDFPAVLNVNLAAPFDLATRPRVEFRKSGSDGVCFVHGRAALCTAQSVLRNAMSALRSSAERFNPKRWPFTANISTP